jgi:hypothetical protein
MSNPEVAIPMLAFYRAGVAWFSHSLYADRQASLLATTLMTGPPEVFSDIFTNNTFYLLDRIPIQ